MTRQVRVLFTQRIVRSSSVQSFRFKPQEAVDFIPGQFLQVIFDENNAGNKELNKYLSFSCAPGKEYFEVTKRMSNSIFSGKLENLKKGDTLLCKLPIGSCVLQDEYQKIGFLIGGIGITPVMSMIEHIVTRSIDSDVCLVYSNRSDADIPFKRELDSWSAEFDNITVNYTITDCEPKDSSCTRGVISSSLLKDAMCDFSSRVIFIFGPPVMVGAMKKVCSDAGCLESNIKAESFTGY